MVKTSPKKALNNINGSISEPHSGSCNSFGNRNSETTKKDIIIGWIGYAEQTDLRNEKHRKKNFRFCSVLKQPSLYWPVFFAVFGD
jgi:hypothetical protein